MTEFARRASLHERADGNLAFIRGAMERAQRVTAVSGAGLLSMGFVGFVAAAVATGSDSLQAQLWIWVISAPLAAVVGAGFCIHKARCDGFAVLGGAGRRFLLCLCPALVVGAVLTLCLWGTPSMAYLPAFWMLTYGSGVMAAGTYAVAPVTWMGATFLTLGGVALFVPADAHNGLLGLAFGFVHVVLGLRLLAKA
ncbi:MAG: hypothetical protein AAF671_10295 [Pseudomonadota bacterium]